MHIVYCPTHIVFRPLHHLSFLHLLLHSYLLINKNLPVMYIGVFSSLFIIFSCCLKKRIELFGGPFLKNNKLFHLTSGSNGIH